MAGHCYFPFPSDEQNTLRRIYPSVFMLSRLKGGSIESEILNLSDYTYPIPENILTKFYRQITSGEDGLPISAAFVFHGLGYLTLSSTVRRLGGGSYECIREPKFRSRNNDPQKSWLIVTEESLGLLHGFFTEECEETDSGISVPKL